MRNRQLQRALRKKFGPPDSEKEKAIREKLLAELEETKKKLAGKEKTE